MELVTGARNIGFKPIWIMSFGVLSMLLGSVVWISIITHQNVNITPSSNILRYAVDNHVAIMLLLVIIAVLYGITLSIVLFNTIRRKANDTRNIWDIVLQFLSAK